MQRVEITKTICDLLVHERRPLRLLPARARTSWYSRPRTRQGTSARGSRTCDGEVRRKGQCASCLGAGWGSSCRDWWCFPLAQDNRKRSHSSPHCTPPPSHPSGVNPPLPLWPRWSSWSQGSSHWLHPGAELDQYTGATGLIYGFLTCINWNWSHVPAWLRIGECRAKKRKKN